MMIFENWPIEKYIIAKLKENEYNVEATTNVVSAKYPFIKRKDLKKIIAKILEKVAGNEKIEGFWVRVGNNWELITKKKLKAIYLPTDDNAEANVGRSNRYNIAPQTNDNPDRYYPPKKEEQKEQKEEIQSVYERMYDKYKKELVEISKDNLNKILLEELGSLGYGEREIKQLKLK